MISPTNKPEYLFLVVAGPLCRDSRLSRLTDVSLSRFEDTAFLIWIWSSNDNWTSSKYVSIAGFRSGEVIFGSCWPRLVLVASDVLEDSLPGGGVLVPLGVPRCRLWSGLEVGEVSVWAGPVHVSLLRLEDRSDRSRLTPLLSVST